MYYISNYDSDLQLSHIKTRLSDFKGVEGNQYHVRTCEKVGQMEMVPVYKYTDGRLVKTNATSVFNVFKNFDEGEVVFDW